MTSQDAPRGVSTTRRRLLAAGGTAIVAAVAGCSVSVESSGPPDLKDVNVINTVDRSIEGSVTVVGPADDTVLEETFGLTSPDEDDENNTVFYNDVWRDAGGYEVSIELTNTEIEDTSQANRTVTINDTDEQKVAISPGSDGRDESIPILVGESFYDFSDTTSN